MAEEQTEAVSEVAPFDWIVIHCDTREAAEAEAKLQQSADTADAEWIYLQVDGRWVAKRTPTDFALWPPDPEQPRPPFWERAAKLVVEFLLAPRSGFGA
jgi:hypothetical protein